MKIQLNCLSALKEVIRETGLLRTDATISFYSIMKFISI